MPPRTVIHTVRVVFLVCCVLLGMSLSVATGGDAAPIHSPVTAALLGLLFGGIMIGLDILLRNMTIRSFSAGTFGLMIGILCAWLISNIPWKEALGERSRNWVQLGL